MAKQGIITAEEAQQPDLGEIPEPDPLPEEEEEEEDDDEDDDEDDSDDDGHRKKKRGPRPGHKRDAGKDDGHKSQDPEVRRKRGRPPRVDTPMETRIKAVMKGIRKLKDPHGQAKVRHFERLPDKGVYPDYYMEIKEPVAIDLIKRKSKRKKYQSVDHFMKDMNLMFNNAKAYNQPESQIYKDAVDLQVESRKLAEFEKKKPDSEYLMEDGRLPLPTGILYKGDLFKVGDWVHIQNPNDVTKPIVAQIYRTWQDNEGDKWINACWYYRPEQTVHHYEKHFYPNEVVKTGQYRDHRIDEVVDRCFVMFVTRYNRGRPRGLPPEKDVYVCESRYNEEKHKLNKIKTWASCLPDEVRERDYEMDLFDVPRRIKKIPSPIKHVLNKDAKETDDLPKATWGADNAPPVVGAVHCRPRDENVCCCIFPSQALVSQSIKILTSNSQESPPPEPTPSPPPSLPQPIPAAPRQPTISQSPVRPNVDGQGNITMAGTGAPVPIRSPAAAVPALQSPVPSVPYPTASMTPAQVYPPAFQRRPSGFAPQTPHAVPYQGTAAAAAVSSPYASAAQQPPYTSYQTSRVPVPPPAAAAYNPNAPRPIEVFQLSDTANSTIPADIREQFHCDDQGHVLFFSCSPLDMAPSTGKKLGHSLKYLAAKEDRRRKIEERKRKVEERQDGPEQAGTPTKQARTTQEQEDHDDPSSPAALAARVEKLTTRAVETMTDHIASGTNQIYESLYGDQASAVMINNAKLREEQVRVDREMKARTAEIRTQVREGGAGFVSLRGNAVYMDGNE